MKGSLALNADVADKRVCILDDIVLLDRLKDYLEDAPSDNRSTEAGDDDAHDIWRFKAISFPRLKPGKLVISMPKQILHQIQTPWNLHPRTVEVFLTNNGVFTKYNSPANG